MDIPDDENYADLKRMLPPSFEHKIKKIYQVEGNVFDVILFANVMCEADAYRWVDEFQNVTCTTFTICTSPAVAGVKVAFKQYRKCRRKTRAAVDLNRRNTNCPAKLTITIRRELKRETGSDRHVHGMPCEIYLYWNHNHPVKSSDFLRFRPVGEEVKKKLVDLYRRGHSPATARDLIKIDLENDHPNDYEEYLADRFHFPGYRFCHYTYRQTFAKEAVPVTVGDHKFLTQKLEEVNLLNHPQKCVDWCLSDDEVIIAICTPLMQRAHRLVSQSAEFVVIYSTLTAARDGHKIFILLTHDNSGGVPLGVLIINSNSAATLAKALQMLQGLVGVDAFFGRVGGPSVFFTEDNETERVAIRDVWEKADIQLSHFHILRAMWLWVTNSKQCISACHRQRLYALFKSVLCAKSVEERDDKYEELKESEIAKAYPNFLAHIATQFWERRQEWDLRYRAREKLRAQGYDAVDHAEAAVRVLNDRVFERIKAFKFNLVQIVDFIVTRMDAHYECKLLDCACNKENSRSHFPKKFLCPTTEVLSQISEIGTSIFSVRSESEGESYNVDVDIARCTCPIGVNGALCKHQVWVALSDHYRPVPERSDDERRLLFELAIGQKPRANWLTPFQDVSARVETNSQPEQGDAEVQDLVMMSEVEPCEIDAGRTILFETLDIGKNSRGNWLAPLDNVPAQVCESIAGASQLEQGDGEEQDLGKEFEEQSGEGAGKSEQALEDGRSSVETICALLREQLNESPEELAPALEILAKKLQRTETLAELLSTLSTFHMETVGVKEEMLTDGESSYYVEYHYSEPVSEAPECIAKTEIKEELQSQIGSENEVQFEMTYVKEEVMTDDDSLHDANDNYSGPVGKAPDFTAKAEIKEELESQVGSENDVQFDIWPVKTEEVDISDVEFPTELADYGNENAPTQQVEQPAATRTGRQRFTSKRDSETDVLPSSDLQPFACQVCDKQFSANCHLQRHASIHKGKKPFECQICSKQFTQGYILNAHIDYHNRLRPYKCEVCEKKFLLQTHVIGHMSTHASEKSHACGICKNRYKRKGDLKRHMAVHSK